MTPDDGVEPLDVPHYGSCPACGYVFDETLDGARVYPSPTTGACYMSRGSDIPTASVPYVE